MRMYVHPHYNAMHMVYVNSTLRSKYERKGLYTTLEAAKLTNGLGFNKLCLHGNSISILLVK